MILTLLFNIGLILNTASADAPGLSIKNAFQIEEGLYRGSEPKSKVSELKKIGITDVLIIKKQNGTEVDDEVQALRDLGIRTKVIPMAWKDTEAKVVCQQVVQAVKALQAAKGKGKTYFHCTMGEDRTGTVAGLYRMLEFGWSAQKAFKEEMCARGFSDGNRGKPRSVTSAIEKTLTPTFIALSRSIESSGSISASVCAKVETKSTGMTCATHGQY